MLEVRRLSVSYGSIGAVQSVSLQVPKGKVVALIGSSGAGKSTILKAIAGHLSPRSGQVIHNGADITGLSPMELIRRGIALASGQGWVFPELTIHDNLVLGHCANLGASDLISATHQVYSLLPSLGEKRGQSAGTLWPSLRKMLLMGRALMSDPGVLLVDESLWDPDPVVALTMGALLRALARRDKAVLLAGRNAALALDVSTYAYVLEAGRIVGKGAPEALRREGDTIHKYLGEPPARKRYVWRAKYGRNS